MDYRVYHAINIFVLHHAWLGRGFADLEAAAPGVVGAAAFALWLLARPGAVSRWKLASASALAAGALALLVNQVIALGWRRGRPFADHPGSHVWGARSHDPSFPSDHASAAFGIAFAVLFFDRIAGALFLIGATAIGIGRIFVGAHYPSDVLAGCLVGLGCAVLVVRLGRPVLVWLVRLVERVTDPMLAPAWRFFARR